MSETVTLTRKNYDEMTKKLKEYEHKISKLESSKTIIKISRNTDFKYLSRQENIFITVNNNEELKEKIDQELSSLKESSIDNFQIIGLKWRKK